MKIVTLPSLHREDLWVVHEILLVLCYYQFCIIMMDMGIVLSGFAIILGFYYSRDRHSFHHPRDFIFFRHFT